MERLKNCTTTISVYPWMMKLYNSVPSRRFKATGRHEADVVIRAQAVADDKDVASQMHQIETAVRNWLQLSPRMKEKALNLRQFPRCTHLHSTFTRNYYELTFEIILLCGLNLWGYLMGMA